MADFPSDYEGEDAPDPPAPPPIAIPYINARDRALQTFHKTQAFLKLVVAERHEAFYKKYQTAVNELESFGSAQPRFLDPVRVNVHLEHNPIDQNRRTWGSDERSMNTIYMMFTDAISLGVSNRDHFVIDGQELEVIDHEIEHEGMGDENFVCRIMLVPSVDR